MTTIAVIAEDEDDALAWAVHNAHRFPDAHISLMWWPEPFRRVLLERINAWKAAAKTKLRDANGLTIGQRLALENPL